MHKMSKVELYYIDGLRPDSWDNVTFISFGAGMLIFYVDDKEGSIRIPLSDIHSFVVS